MIEISSAKNPKIKYLLELQLKSRERTKNKIAIVEGFREINMALKACLKLKELYYCSEIQNFNNSFLNNKTSEIYKVSKCVYEKIAYRENKDGYIAVFEYDNITFDIIKLKANPLIIVLDNIEKPGNLGAILRTTEAANVDLIIITGLSCDIYSPNVIRASLGGVFKQKIIKCNSDEAINWLNKSNIKTYAAELKATSLYWNFDYKKPTAFIMGSEAFGLSDEWINNCNERIIIPMKGEIDSLNISVSTAILLYECARQRS